MDPNVISAIIGAVVSLLIVFLSNILISRNDLRAVQKKEDRLVRLDALSPLRLYAAETYIRLQDIQYRIQADKKEHRCGTLLLENEGTTQCEWARTSGCYLASTCYIVACLFCYLYRAKAKLSYLRLSKEELGKLVTLISDVTIAFTTNGIYYGVQMAAGSRIFDEDRGQPISYADFSERLDDPKEWAWYELILNCFVSLGEGYDVRDDHLTRMLNAVQKLCEYLDGVIGDCFFLEARKKGDCEHIYPDGSQRAR